jgi:predicted transcriptional regulator
MTVLVEQHISGLELNANFAEAKAWVEHAQMDSLIITSEGRLIGLLDAQFLFDTRFDQEFNRLEDYINAYPEEIEQGAYIRLHDHIFSAAEAFSHELNDHLPVVDHDHNYVGIRTRNDVLEELCEFLNMSQKGTVIDVLLPSDEPLISEIIRLVETEGIHVQTITVQQPNLEEEHRKLTIKFDSEEVSNAISTLERFGYTVYTPHRDLQRDIDFHERANELIRLLDL